MGTKVKFELVEEQKDYSEAIIQWTLDHKRFKLDLANRPIDQRHLAKLIKAIKRKNLLHLYPIIVRRDFFVIDGQHRVKAAEALGLPVYYIISDQMGIQDASLVNDSTKGWTLYDYLHHWTMLGVSSYKTLKEFHERNSWLPINVAARLICSRGGAQWRTDFNNGIFVADQVELAERVVLMLRDFKKYIDFYADKRFVVAIRGLAQNPNYNHGRMMKKMDYLHMRLIKQPDTESYYPVITEIYNYRTPEENRVQFVKPMRKRHKVEEED